MLMSRTAERKRVVAHVSRAAVRGKSKGSAPAKRTCTFSGTAGRLAHLKDRLRVPLQNSRPGTRKSKETHQRGESIIYPRDLNDRENTQNRAEMEP
jgi:hypothetical protein